MVRDQSGLLPLGLRKGYLYGGIRDMIPILQQEDRQDRNENQPSDDLRRLGKRAIDQPNQALSIIAVPRQEYSDPRFLCIAPAVLLAEIRCNLPGRETVNKHRELID